MTHPFHPLPSFLPVRLALASSLVLATLLPFGCASAPKVQVENRTTQNINVELRMPGKEALGRTDSGMTYLRRIQPGEKWSPTSGDQVTNVPNYSSYVMVQASAASLLEPSGPPVSGAFEPVDGELRILISPEPSGSVFTLVAVDEGGNPLLLRPVNSVPNQKPQRPYQPLFPASNYPGGRYP